jgi:molybdenum cofactor cytidylyltransferase
MNGGINFGVAILAAGASVRMGRPKMLLPWEGSSVIGHVLQVWSEELGAAQIAVVCAPAPSPVPGELDRIGFPARNRITNPAPERGMFSSIQAAASWSGWNAGLTHIAVTLGDQPHVRVETLRKLLEAVQRNPNTILQPCFNGRPKHPIIFHITDFRSLAETKHETLRDFLAVSKRTLVDVDDSGLNLDLDYPADYEKARALAAQTVARVPNPA